MSIAMKMTALPVPSLSTTAEQLELLLASEGTAAHSYCASAIARKPEGFVRSSVDFADAVHILSLLHGQAPGLINHAETRIAEPAAREWLASAVDGFARERAYLNRIVVAAGPAPSTAGQNRVSAVIMQQRHALEMLALSDRRGCALGAAVALVLDWRAIRGLLDGGSARLGVDPPYLVLPDHVETMHVLSDIEDDYRICRAVQFGASQLLSQHRGVWDLLEARAEARRTAIF
jgi:hypothetical protein